MILRLALNGLGLFTTLPLELCTVCSSYRWSEALSSEVYPPGWLAGNPLVGLVRTSQLLLERMQRVLSAPMQFPSDFDATAKMTVKGLLDRSPARRLGCGVVGLQDIMRSPFFEHINFDKVETRSHKPPFVPTDLFEFDSLSEDLKKEGKRVVSDRTRAALEPTSDPEFPDF